MPLTPDEQEQFLKWLREKGGQNDASCPVCGRDDRWSPGDFIVAPEVTTEGNVQIDAESVIPMVQLYCVNCGYMRLFQANIIGLRPQPQTE